MLLEKGACYHQCGLLVKVYWPSPTILNFKAKFACYTMYLLTSSFCIPVPYDVKDIFFFDVKSRRSFKSYRTFQLFCH